MGPRVGGLGGGREARGRKRGDQARPALLALALLPALAGCGRLAELNPVPAFANMFGADLDGRPPPPGADGPWPNLAQVPPRPVPPDATTRAGLTAALAADRDRARAPLDRAAAAPAAMPGLPDLPQGGPPPPPRLAAVPPLRLDPVRAGAAAPALVPGPSGGPPAPGAALPAAPPPAPLPDLLAPPPPPARDLFAPRAN